MVQWRWTGLSVVACIALLASFARIAADWEWLVALGDHVRGSGTIPDRVPFAAASTEGWHNVPVAAELVASVVDDLGGASGTVGFHLLVVVTALLVLTVSARHLGASDARTAVLLAVVCIGALPALALVRLQTFSLVLFAALLALLWHQDRRPSRHVWWLPVLIALWGNLHGAALLGVCVAGAYLLFGRLRMRPVETVAVGVSTVLALCVTPQGWRTVAYYASVLDNEAAHRAEGLWARPDLSQPVDLLMVGAVGVLALTGLRRRQRVWEYVACIGLGIATIEAARHGVWLLFVLFMVAAVPAEDDGRKDRWARRPVALVGGLSALVVASLLMMRGSDVAAVDPEAVAAVVAEVQAEGDAVVLAPAPLVESLAARGVTVWVGNPLDAFEPDAQRAYLDFLAGESGMRTAVAASDLVVVQEDSASEAGLTSLGVPLERRDLPGGFVMYARR